MKRLKSNEEEIVIKYTVSKANKFKVPAKQWKKWNDASKYVFNEVYSSMLNNGWVFMHPDCVVIPTHWKTICWNAAWTAASAVR